MRASNARVVRKINHRQKVWKTRGRKENHSDEYFVKLPLGFMKKAKSRFASVEVLDKSTIIMKLV